MKLSAQHIFGAFLMACIGGLVALSFDYFIHNQTSTIQTSGNNIPGHLIHNTYATNQSIPPGTLNFSGIETDFTKAAEASIHSVVHVKTVFGDDKFSSESQLFDFFFGDGYKYSPDPVMASGSGVIVSPDGYIITNNHVIEHNKSIEVILNDKRTYKAELIGTDPTTDIAVLKIDDTNLPYMKYGNSDNLLIGEWVLAVGNPFNLTSTVTAGIVSAKARNINALNKRFAIEAFIQTDAAVNPGNSGGALVNQQGELIGINTAIASHTGYFAGYSFAVPINLAAKVVKDIMEYGMVQRAVLGVSILDIDAKLAKEYDIEKIEGVYVADVTDDGAAKEAGMKNGDIIVKINGKNVNNVAQLQEQIGKFRPGDKVDITVKRANKMLSLKAELKNKHGNTEIVNVNSETVLGAEFEKITPEDKLRYRIKQGVRIVEINDGKLKDAGLEKGFIITFINKEPIYEIKDIYAIIDSTDGGVYIEGRYPDGSKGYFAFGIK